MSNFGRCLSVPTTAAEEAGATKRTSSGICEGIGLVAHALFAHVSSMRDAQHHAEDARGHTNTPTPTPTQRTMHKETAPQSPRETYVAYTDTYWRTYTRDQFRKRCFDNKPDHITGLRMGFAS